MTLGLNGDNVPGYAELHCLSDFSFLRGASFPEELVERAAELGYSALAITDECSLSGIVRAHIAARDLAAANPGKPGLKLIVGSEFFSQDGMHLVLLAPSRRAYAQLAHLITMARRGAAKGHYCLTGELLKTHPCLDCLALWVPVAETDARQQEQELRLLRQLFPGRLWIAVALGTSPISLPQSSSGRFDVITVERVS